MVIGVTETDASDILGIVLAFEMQDSLGGIIDVLPDLVADRFGSPHTWS